MSKASFDSQAFDSQTGPGFRVIKVGGSLFTLPDLRAKISDWAIREADAECVNVWVAGGGAVVEAVRDWQSTHGLSESDAHGISITMLASTARLFHSLFTDWPLVTGVEDLRRGGFNAGSDVVFDCSRWAQANRDLTPSWDTTSDTIALHLAKEINAAGIYLLKSTSPLSTKISDAVSDGVLDRNFDDQRFDFTRISVALVNLRRATKTFEMVW